MLSLLQSLILEQRLIGDVCSPVGQWRKWLLRSRLQLFSVKNLHNYPVNILHTSVHGICSTRVISLGYASLKICVECTLLIPVLNYVAKSLAVFLLESLVIYILIICSHI